MAKSAQRNVSGFGTAAVGLFRMLAGSCPDLRQHLVAEQFDRLEECRVRPAANVPLDDLPRMPATLAKEGHTDGPILRAAGRNHSATPTLPTQPPHPHPGT